jgi:hypothetical protein
MTQLAINNDDTIQEALSSVAVFVIMIVCTFAGVMFVVHDCIKRPEHITSKLAVAVLYCCALWDGL